MFFSRYKELKIIIQKNRDDFFQKIQSVESRCNSKTDEVKAELLKEIDKLKTLCLTQQEQK